MSTSVSPLNNPPGPGGGVVKVNKYPRTPPPPRTPGVKESLRTIGGQQGTACALVSCAVCSRLQNIVWALPTPHQFHKCQGCGELLPTDSYRVFTYGWPPLLEPSRLPGNVTRGGR